jgi:hypothetical protein
MITLFIHRSSSQGPGATYSVYSVRSSFTLQVNATDALRHTASATLQVTVDPECLHC